MNEIINKTIYDLEGRKYIISKKIGEGAQGVVYESTDGFIIKINYTKNITRHELVSRYKWIMSQRIPKEARIVTPIAILEEPYTGYVMNKVRGHIPLDKYITPSNKVPLDEWFNILRGGLKKRLEIGALLAKSLRNLHMVGLTYCDLSPNNILVAEKQNSIVLIDPDNLTSTGMFKPSILGTPRYIAPELFKGNTQPNSLTDTYSYAVILFETLRLGHPLIGDKIIEGSPEEEDEALKGNAIYINHPTDDSNVNSGLTETEVLITDELKELFKKVFVDGLHEYIKRPTLNEFRTACLKAKDSLITCDNVDCKAFFYYKSDAENKCPWCSEKKDDILNFTFMQNITLKEFKLLDINNKGEYKKFYVNHKSPNKLTLNEGIQTLNKRHFESILPAEKDENIIAVKVDDNKNVIVKKLKDLPLFIYNKDNSTVKPFNLNSEEKLTRQKNAIMFVKNFNIIGDKPLKIEDITKIYGDTVVINYAALY